LLQLLMFAVVISVAFPYFLIALFPVCALFVAVTVYFNRSNRQIRRIEALVRSPVFSEISTLLTGLQTLRVYGQTREFADQLLARADTFSSAVFMFWSLSRWLALRLDLTCSVVVLVASVIAVSLRGVVSASFAAIAITYSMRMSSFLQWTFRNLSIMESSAVSAERLIEYADDIPTEPQGGSSDVPENWPDKGEIEFDNVSVRYAPQLPLSLRSLQLRVGAGQHVGVVGRTGAGKSTLASVLFRLRELDSGVIRIDGIDISLLSLKTLRSRLSIITQVTLLVYVLSCSDLCFPRSLCCFRGRCVSIWIRLTCGPTTSCGRCCGAWVWTHWWARRGAWSFPWRTEEPI
jgi:ATP-binding cassette subfamily C (CFTR/MRP) protein 1